jgi:hypothetical protein
MAEERDEGFRVVDRRLFTPEGELREEVREQIEQQQAAAQAKKESTQTAGQQQAVTGERPRRSPAFESLIELVVQNAQALMGGMADPRTGQPLVDLVGAREMIDMLDALREKTRGRLAPEEEQLLLSVTGTLKMQYLQLSEAVAAGRERNRKKM